MVLKRVIGTFYSILARSGWWLREW
jgi:hypothetical protein